MKDDAQKLLTDVMEQAQASETKTLLLILAQLAVTLEETNNELKSISRGVWSIH
jgi:hypothetical protein